MGESHFNEFIRLRYQLVVAAENCGREGNLSAVQIATTIKDLDKELKRAHKIVDAVVRANRKICVTLMRYNLDKSGSSFAQVRIFAMIKEEEKLQLIVYVMYKFEELQLFYFHYSFIRVRVNWNNGDNRNLRLKSKLGLHHVVLTTPKTFPEKFTRTLVEKHYLPDLGKNDPKEEISCPKWTIKKDRKA